MQSNLLKASSSHPLLLSSCSISSDGSSSSSSSCCFSSSLLPKIGFSHPPFSSCCSCSVPVIDDFVRVTMKTRSEEVETDPLLGNEFEYFYYRKDIVAALAQKSQEDSNHHERRRRPKGVPQNNDTNTNRNIDTLSISCKNTTTTSSTFAIPNTGGTVHGGSIRDMKPQFFIVTVVPPYPTQFVAAVKTRWIGQRVLDVFEREFKAHDVEYYRSAIERGDIWVSNRYQKLSMCEKQLRFNINNDDHSQNDKSTNQPDNSSHTEYLARSNSRKRQKMNQTMVMSQAALSDYALQNGDFIFHKTTTYLDCLGSPECVRVLYDDSDMCVAYKPPGMPCQPQGQYQRLCLLYVLKTFHYQQPQMYLHPINRLDRVTCGIVILAKQKVAARSLSAALVHSVKLYIARVQGLFPIKRQPLTVVCDAQNGKPSETRFFCISHHGSTSLVLCLPVTGRTHQIRVHLQHLGYPIVDDVNYSVAALSEEHRGLRNRIRTHQQIRLEFPISKLEAAEGRATAAAGHVGEKDETRVDTEREKNFEYSKQNIKLTDFLKNNTTCCTTNTTTRNTVSTTATSTGVFTTTTTTNTACTSTVVTAPSLVNNTTTRTTTGSDSYIYTLHPPLSICLMAIGYIFPYPSGLLNFPRSTLAVGVDVQASAVFGRTRPLCASCVACAASLNDGMLAEAFSKMVDVLRWTRGGKGKEMKKQPNAKQKNETKEKKPEESKKEEQEEDGEVIQVEQPVMEYDNIVGFLSPLKPSWLPTE